MNRIVRGRKVRVGVLGAFRGKAFIDNAAMTGMELACICDNFKHRLDEVCGELKVAGYEDFDEMLKADIDAVIIAGPFHQHAQFAKRALLAGKHVLTETSCNVTLADGVELYRLAQETGLCYMLAENYCYTRFNQEMKRLYEAGEIGEIRYAEGEYNHPMSLRLNMWYAPGYYHWRNWLPACYYITHALAPMMYITGTMPKAVSCVRLNNPGRDPLSEGSTAYVMLIRMDNGSVFRIYGGCVAGHSNWYGFHGADGAMECVRGHGYFGPEQIRVWHEPWTLKPGQVAERSYYPEWPEHGEEAETAGHGGGDYFVEKCFADAITTGEEPYLNAYRGVMMSNVGILAWRSIHQDGAWLPVPDLRDPAAQEEMLKDRLSPFTGVEGAELMSEDMLAITEFTPEIVQLCREEWAKLGYSEDEIEQLLKK